MPKTNNNSIKSFIFLSRSGCLLPLLIIFNLLFGWIFLKLQYWLMSEIILLLLFIINGYIITRKIISTSVKRDNIIDVEGKVEEENLDVRQ